MAYEEKYRTAELAHNVIMEGRRRVSVSGVDDVGSFDECEIVIGTTKGILTVRGQDLHIEKLSLDSGDIIMEGDIDSLSYEDDVRKSGGFLNRLFK